jgi:hypothetical protein
LIKKLIERVSCLGYVAMPEGGPAAEKNLAPPHCHGITTTHRKAPPVLSPHRLLTTLGGNNAHGRPELRKA